MYKMSIEERKAYDFINGKDKEALISLGFIVEDLDILDKFYRTIEKKIYNADCVFIGGGNTFFLMQELKRKGIDKAIARHIAKGKLYISTSAGSVMLQKDIIEDPNDESKLGPDLNGDFSGLGIIDFYLYVHYGRHYYGDDDQFFNKYYAHLNCIKIDDNQAVAVKGDKAEVVTASKSRIPKIPAF